MAKNCERAVKYIGKQHRRLSSYWHIRQAVCWPEIPKRHTRQDLYANLYATTEQNYLDLYLNSNRHIPAALRTPHDKPSRPETLNGVPPRPDWTNPCAQKKQIPVDCCALSHVFFTESGCALLVSSAGEPAGEDDAGVFIISRKGLPPLAVGLYPGATTVTTGDATGGKKKGGEGGQR